MSTDPKVPFFKETPVFVHGITYIHSSIQWFVIGFVYASVVIIASG